MNEAETRAELIDPKLKDSGWGTIEDTKVLREHHITIGKIQTGGGHHLSLFWKGPNIEKEEVPAEALFH